MSDKDDRQKLEELLKEKREIERKIEEQIEEKIEKRDHESYNEFLRDSYQPTGGFQPSCPNSCT
ncbi:hypothetical protein [Marinobacter sp.]|uniref:hypothetical protein n=1 Tax=Marinobacter sp. TaxID=50741 RepID=UPI001B531BB6|nr:hypothetical protein [Marinobacter sp.]MBQ0833091.1 hypothetical protein [Marinobacter sp.]